MLRKSLHEQLIVLPTHRPAAELRQAIDAVDGADKPATVSSVYAYVEKGRTASIDATSFVKGIRELVDNGTYTYSSEPGGEPVPVLRTSMRYRPDGWSRPRHPSFLSWTMAAPSK